MVKNGWSRCGCADWCVEGGRTMIAITVDDEQPVLQALTAAVAASPDISSVTEFASCMEALEWVQCNYLDVAFLETRMGSMSGLTLAQKILQAQPSCRIVFCTAYPEYAVQAFQLRASGYLIKPVTASGVQKEIDYIKGQDRKPLLTVKCFGNFEVLCRGEALRFKRTKSKEVLAVLIDRNGAGVTGKQICAVVWPDDTNDTKNMDYLRHLMGDLRNTFNAAGLGDLLRQEGYSYRLDLKRIECDYYNFLRSGKPVFRGEYMTQYSWAEETCAMLLRK